MVSTTAEAALFVSFCRFPPRNQRSFRPRGLLCGGPDYFARANEDVVALVTLEVREAVETADAILATPRLDGIYVGPNDLCLAYGQVPSREIGASEVVATIVDLAARAGSPASSARAPRRHCGAPTRASAWSRSAKTRACSCTPPRKLSRPCATPRQG